LKIVRTEDGSLTLFSEKFNEPYHSLTAGAFKEAVEKFCKPCKIEEKAKKADKKAKTNNSGKGNYFINPLTGKKERGNPLWKL